MPKQDIVVGDLWRRDDKVFIVTREQDAVITSHHGTVYYCQEIGNPYGILFSPDYLNAYLQKVPNFFPTASI